MINMNSFKSTINNNNSEVVEVAVFNHTDLYYAVSNGTIRVSSHLKKRKCMKCMWHSRKLRSTTKSPDTNWMSGEVPGFGPHA